MDKYKELKNELKKYELMYPDGPLTNVLKLSRLAIIDLQEEVGEEAQ